MIRGAKTFYRDPEFRIILLKVLKIEFQKPSLRVIQRVSSIAQRKLLYLEMIYKRLFGVIASFHH